MASIIVNCGGSGPTSNARFMDKRQLRTSAFADFMQSLEHLDELLGETADHVVLEEENSQTSEQTTEQVAETIKPQPSPLVTQSTKLTSRQPKSAQPPTPRTKP